MKRPHIVARFGGAVRLNAIQVGKAMQDLGFEVIRRHSSRFLLVKERPVTDIGILLPNMEDLLKTLTINKVAASHYPFSCR